MTVFWIVAACFIIAALLFAVPPLLQRTDARIDKGIDKHNPDKENHNREKGQPAARSAINATIYQDQLAELENDLRNDMVQPEQYAQARRELERRLLDDVTIEAAEAVAADAPATPPAAGRNRVAAIVVGIMVPLFTVLVYLKIGNPEVMSPQTEMASVGAEAGAAGEQGGQRHSDAPAQIQKMVDALVERLRANPQDAEGWAVLGRSFYALGRHAEAADAFSKATELVPNDAQLLADYADAMAMANGERLDERSIALIRRAVQADPNNQKALWLGGTAEFESGNFAGAVKYWEHLLKLLPPNSEVSQTMAANIEEARGLASGNPNSSSSFPTMNSDAPLAAASGGATGSGATVAGTVTITPTLAGKIAPTDTVFIFARAAQGPRMPLAILRAQAKDLPLTFSLDDTMAAMPTMKLSSAAEVIVGARISKSGDAMPRAGDLQGSSTVVKVGSTGVNITIDSVAP
jgi:cytochrome c-type biogenesis protein CcmH